MFHPAFDRILAGAAVLAGLGVTVLAAGQAEALDLLPPPGEFRSSSDPIQVDIGGVDPGATIFLTLDGLDITEFASIEGQVVTVQLAAPLSGGQHELSLLRELPDGSLVTDATWPLVVKVNGWWESAGLGIDITHSLWGRVKAQQTPGLPEAVTGNGAADVRGEMRTHGVTLKGYAPFLWDSDQSTFQDENGTVGDWLLEGSVGPADLRIGHQQVGPPTLVMDAFHRRGLGLTLRSELLRSEATGFALHGTPLIGFFEGLGVHDSDDRVIGVQFHSTPLETELAELSVTGVWAEGRTPDNGAVGTGLVGDSNVVDGVAWGLQGKAALLGRRILVSGDYAHTNWEMGFGTQADDAYSVEVILDPFPNLYWREYPATLQATVNTSAIGTDFYSIVNPSLLSDRRTLGFRSDFSLAGLFLGVYAGEIEDNVNSDELIPTERVKAWSIETSFSPAEVLGGERRGALRWLGMPTAYGSYRFDRLESIFVPTGYPDADRLGNNATSSIQAGLSFQFDTWAWSLSYSRFDSDDKGPDNFDSVQQQGEFRVDGSLGPVSLGAGLSVQYTNLQGSPNPANILTMINVRTPIWPGHVYFTGDLTFDRAIDTRDTSDAFGIVANASLDWTVLEPASWYPGVTISFLGSYQGGTDLINPSFDQDAYQLYLRTTLAWPILLGTL